MIRNHLGFRVEVGDQTRSLQWQDHGQADGECLEIAQREGEERSRMQRLSVCGRVEAMGTPGGDSSELSLGFG